MKERLSFVDYLRGGLQVSLSVAIDFTGSNGTPTDPRSLHFMGPNNQYEAAIGQVGSILEPYDSDRMFPTFGFGGIPRYMGANAVSHCFAMNGTPANPEIYSVQNIVQCYRDKLPGITLSGPTYFGEILNQFNQYTGQQ